MTSTETPTAGRSAGGNPTTTKITIGLVVVLALLALIVGVSTSSGSAPLLLGPSTPTRVTIPALAVSSTLIPTGLNPDQTLAVPPLTTPMQASWYDRTPTPGELGPSVILGHINGSGKPGIFRNLDKIQAGQQVDVDRADGQTATFVVSRVDTIPKSSFPTDQVYNNTTNAQLRLITCGGEFDRASRNYLSNVIVYADLVAVRKT